MENGKDIGGIRMVRRFFRGIITDECGHGEEYIIGTIFIALLVIASVMSIFPEAKEWLVNTFGEYTTTGW